MLICPECLAVNNYEIPYTDLDTAIYKCGRCGELFEIDDYDPGHEDDYPAPLDIPHDVMWSYYFDLPFTEGQSDRFSGNPDLPSVSGNRP